MISAVLGISEVSAESLFDLAAEALGQPRAGRCLELCRLAGLSRRSAVTSAVAELIAGSRQLGEAWWGRPHHEMVTGHAPADGNRRVIGWEDRGTPDARLAQPGLAPEPGIYRPAILENVGCWIQDDAADLQWGRPVDYVDLNDFEPADRIVLPEGAQPGDRFVASFDPGSRVWVDIVRWDHRDLLAEQRGHRRGLIGSKLAEHDICEVSEVGWAWAVATDIGPVLLPGESAGGPSDPFAGPLDADVARQLRDWAAAHEDDSDKVGAPWRTKGDLWAARYRLGAPRHRGGDWHLFDQAARAAVDEDLISLHKALSKLR